MVVEVDGSPHSSGKRQVAIFRILFEINMKIFLGEGAILIIVARIRFPKSKTTGLYSLTIVAHGNVCMVHKGSLCGKEEWGWGGSGGGVRGI